MQGGAKVLADGLERLGERITGADCKRQARFNDMRNRAGASNVENRARSATHRSCDRHPAQTTIHQRTIKNARSTFNEDGSTRLTLEARLRRRIRAQRGALLTDFQHRVRCGGFRTLKAARRLVHRLLPFSAWRTTLFNESMLMTHLKVTNRTKFTWRQTFHICPPVTFA